jgi:transcriptional regulator with XRE-family HTH domain
VPSAEQDRAGEILGRFLREHRETLGLSLEQVAGTADMSTSGLWLIEQGRRMPSAYTLAKIAHAMGLEDRSIASFLPMSWVPMPHGLPGVRLISGED